MNKEVDVFYAAMLLLVVSSFAYLLGATVATVEPELPESVAYYLYASDKVIKDCKGGRIKDKTKDYPKYCYEEFSIERGWTLVHCFEKLGGAVQVCR